MFKTFNTKILDKFQWENKEKKNTFNMTVYPLKFISFRCVLVLIISLIKVGKSCEKRRLDDLFTLIKR